MVKTVVSYFARDWINNDSAIELSEEIVKRVDFSEIGSGVMEFPCIMETTEGPCEIMAFAFAGNDGPEVRIQLRSENAVENKKCL